MEKMKGGYSAFFCVQKKAIAIKKELVNFIL